MLLKTAMCAILELGNRGLLPLIHVIASPIRGAAINSLRHCEPQQGRGNLIPSVIASPSRGAAIKSEERYSLTRLPRRCYSSQ